jgi:hypothetical protein
VSNGVEPVLGDSSAGARAVLRAVLGAIVAFGIAACGVVVGVARAAVAPPDAPAQAVFSTDGPRIVVAYVAGFVICGVGLGLLWPVAVRSRAGSSIVGASIGALFGLTVLPAMRAALPNWPVGAGSPRGPGAWIVDLVCAAAAGAIVGWRFPLFRRNHAKPGEAFKENPPVV